MSSWRGKRLLLWCPQPFRVRAGASRASGRRHPLQDNQPPHIINEVLQADLCRRARDADRAHEPPAWRRFLRAKNS